MRLDPLVGEGILPASITDTINAAWHREKHRLPALRASSAKGVVDLRPEVLMQVKPAIGTRGEGDGAWQGQPWRGQSLFFSLFHPVPVSSTMKFHFVMVEFHVMS
jgi:hypothetical protein